MNIVICDDELVLALETKKLVEQYFAEKDIEVNTDTFTNSSDLAHNIKYYDIAFLDIEIDNLNGIDIVRLLMNINPHIVVFIVTSYNKYLDDAMDMNVFRFLTKPLEKQRLFAGLDKATELISHENVEFVVKGQNFAEKISILDIVCVYVYDRGTSIVTQNGTFESKEKISWWREKLKRNFFYSPHHSYIINMNHVSAYSDKQIKMANKFTVPLSSRKASDFKRDFLSFITNRG